MVKDTGRGVGAEATAEDVGELPVAVDVPLDTSDQVRIQSDCNQEFGDVAPSSLSFTLSRAIGA